jgi:putative transcriptional regulator
MKELETGTFLLAKDTLKGSFFEDAVIFLANYSPIEGAYGFIINRLARIPVNEMFNSIPKEYWRPVEVFLGGPVDEQDIQILQINKSKANESSEIIPGFFLGGDFSHIQSFVETVMDDTQSLLFMGYSGWSKSQLEKEIKEGSWELLKLEQPEIVFMNSAQEYQLSPHEFSNKFSPADQSTL